MARKVATETKNMKSTKHLTVLIPGFDGTVNGMHSRIQCPSDANTRKVVYSGGKKKAFTFKHRYIRHCGWIVEIIDTTSSSTHDMIDLRRLLLT